MSAVCFSGIIQLMDVFDYDGLPHYYGDTVRKLFLVAGIIMLVTLPFFSKSLPQPLFISLLAIVVITTFAGFTSPRSFFIVILNALVSLIALLFFEYYAVISASGGIDEPLFLINQILALISFFALYYSLKTVRGVFLIKKESKF